MPRSSFTPSMERLEIRALLNGSMPGAPEVEAQFAELKHHAEAIGWILPEDQGAADPDVVNTNHYEGIVRYPGTGTPIFYVTQKDTDDNGFVTPSVPLNGGYLEVVRMGSRDTDGQRLRSNLQRIGEDTEGTGPPAADTWISQFHFDGQSGVTVDGQTLRPYFHPGGMAIEDNILLLALDSRQPFGPGVGGVGEILLFDLAENGGTPEAPVVIQGLELSHGIDNLAITLIGEEGNQNNPLRYLIWTNGDGGDEVHVYETNVPDLRDPVLSINHVQTWNPNSADDFDPGFDTSPFPQSIAWPDGSQAHQSSTFIREFDGLTPPTDAPLYMIGMRRDGLTPLTGDDKADLYRVDVTVTGGFSHVKLTLVNTRLFVTEYDNGGHMGNFAAGGNGYVSPTGELILYNIPHDDQDGFDPDIVRMAEIRHRDVNREGSSLRLPSADPGGPYVVDEGGSIGLSGTGALPADRPWVELYDDDGFASRSIVIDYDDRFKLELNEFDELDDFTDRTTSIRWRLPSGMSVELFPTDNFEGTPFTLIGDGTTRNIPNFTSFGVSSLQFIGSPPTASTLEFDWDLDGDGIFGETGVDAPNGDELGASPTFVTGGIDGPGDYDVALRVVDSFGHLKISHTTVTVNNIPPTAAITGDTFGVPGMPRNFTFTASDLSAADVAAGFDFSFGFGDGSNGVIHSASPLPLTHTYLIEGNFVVNGIATDKDAGPSLLATHLIQIKAAGILPDPTDPTKTALLVGGTLGNDVIKIIQQGKTGDYEVTINGVSKGIFSPTGRIIIFGQAGNDFIDVPNSVALPVEMYGGEGNDILDGGAGPDLLVGENGNDVLAGGQGRDILIGGAGVDLLDGNADDDVLVGSRTIHDSNFGALQAIQAEWLRTDIAASIRSAHLLDGTGLNGPAAKLDAASILDDGLADVLVGASGDNFTRQ